MKPYTKSILALAVIAIFIQVSCKNTDGTYTGFSINLLTGAVTAL